MNKRRQNYSLVEILAVIAISAVVITIAAPMFSKLFGGGGVDFATAQLKTYIDQARSLAISNRKNVALVFDAEGKNYEHPGKQAIRPCFVSLSGSTITFESWIPEQPWKMIPNESIIIRIADDAPTTKESGDFTISDFDDYSTTTDAAPKVAVPNTQTATSTSISFPSIIFTPYGNSMYAKSYITVAEGVLAGDTFIYKNLTDNEINNRITIMVKKFTGKTEYINETN